MRSVKSPVCRELLPDLDHDRLVDVLDPDHHGPGRFVCQVAAVVWRVRPRIDGLARLPCRSLTLSFMNVNMPTVYSCKRWIDHASSPFLSFHYRGRSRGDGSPVAPAPGAHGGRGCSTRGRATL